MTTTPAVSDYCDSDALQYPYNHNNIESRFDDPYKRSSSWILKSLSHFGNINRHAEILLPPEIQGTIPLLSRFADGSMTPNDVPHLLGLFPPLAIKGRIILPTQIMEQDITFITSHDSLQNVRLLEQIIILHHFGQDMWAIFLVFTTRHTIEGYFTAETDMSQVLGIVQKIGVVLGLVLPESHFTCRQRFRMPQTFQVNQNVMIFILVHYLHQHGGYLELSHKSIMEHQCTYMRSFINGHDRWLGHFHLRHDTNVTHPFIVTGNQKKDNLTELLNLGWAVIDVLPDGNCGYYTFLLGLENNNNHVYSARNSPSLRTWQSKVLQLRTRLQQQSQLLLRSEYPIHSRDQKFWENTTVYGLELEEYSQLSEPFLNDELSPDQYFDANFVHLTDNHMDPTWAPHVFSFSFHLRVVSYTRVTNYMKNGKKKYSWSTRTFDYDQPPDERDVLQPGLHRMSDQEYKRKPTVEILYVTGYRPTDDQHFQFLRRIICDGVEKQPLPSKQSIGQCLTALVSRQAKIGTRKRSQDATAKSSTVPMLPRNHPEPPPTAVRTSPNNTRQSNDMTTVPVSTPTARGGDSTTAKSTEKDTDNVSTPTTICKGTSRKRTREEVSTATTTVPVTTRDEVPTATTTVAVVTTGKPMVAVKSFIARKGTKAYRVEKGKTTKALTKLYKTQSDTPTVEKKLTATKMRYDSTTGEFYKKDWDHTNENYTTPVLVENVEDYNDDIVRAAMLFEGDWMGPTIGDAGCGMAPETICTRIPTIYQQHNNRYCMTYSLASALFYCGFKTQAEVLANCAEPFSKMHFDQAITELRGFMENLVPVIGQPTIYGRKTRCHNRFKRELKWDDLFNYITPYPTLVVPVLPSGETSHAFCVVDDLIFDSITQFTLKLNMDSIKWIFNDMHPEIFLALRFNHKISPPKRNDPEHPARTDTRVKEKYTRKVTYHWKNKTLSSQMEVD